MRSNRRQFFKICAGGMAGTAVATLSLSPKLARGGGTSNAFPAIFHVGGFQTGMTFVGSKTSLKLSLQISPLTFRSKNTIRAKDCFFGASWR